MPEWQSSSGPAIGAGIGLGLWHFSGTRAKGSANKLAPSQTKPSLILRQCACNSRAHHPRFTTLLLSTHREPCRMPKTDKGTSYDGGHAAASSMGYSLWRAPNKAIAYLLTLPTPHLASPCPSTTYIRPYPLCRSFLQPRLLHHSCLANPFHSCSCRDLLLWPSP